MRSTDVVVVGAGPAGLAMSRYLAAASVDHVVLERESPGSSWRQARWDSLRTLTPNWMNGLPGLPYRGLDPEGYMTASEVAERIEAYARSGAAPVLSGVEVQRITARSGAHLVEAAGDEWRAAAVVLATGPGRTRTPSWAGALPSRVQQLTTEQYRNPAQVTGDRILVVGAGASGVQLADELAAAGRQVTLSVGEHVRLPRTYRGRDVFWWLQAMGITAARWDEDPLDLPRARRVPSAQLIGDPERRSIGLASLQKAGVALVGRVAAVDGRRIQLAGSLARVIAAADLKELRFLDQVDEFVSASGLHAPPPQRWSRTPIPPTRAHVDVADFDAVIWATGPAYPSPPLVDIALDRRGAPAHDGGVGRTPGLFVMGRPFLRRRSSTFLSGFGRDASELSVEIRRHLDRVVAA